jgi:hypothetical protein
MLALSSGCTSAGVGDGSDGGELNAGQRVPLPDPCALVSAQTAMSLVGPTLGVPGNDFFLQKGVGVPDELDELDELDDLADPRSAAGCIWSIDEGFAEGRSLRVRGSARTRCSSRCATTGANLIPLRSDSTENDRARMFSRSRPQRASAHGERGSPAPTRTPTPVVTAATCVCPSRSRRTRIVVATTDPSGPGSTSAGCPPSRTASPQISTTTPTLSPGLATPLVDAPGRTTVRTA